MPLTPSPDLIRSACRALALVACPVLSLSGQTAHPAAAIVARPYSLLRHGTPGETVRYRIARINHSVDRRGRVLSTIEAHGIVDRTLVQQVEPGVWAEDFTWRAFAMGEAPDLSAGGGALLTYRADPRGFDLFGTFAGDIGLDPMAAIMFRVLILDSWTWDAVVHELRMKAGAEVPLGREFRIPGWDSAKAITLGPNAEARYRMAPILAGADGVTMCGETPCLRVAFRIVGNEVVQTMGPLTIDGVESFHAAAYLSLADGRLLRGELWGPIMATMTPTAGAEPMPTAGFLTEVVMEAVDPASR